MQYETCSFDINIERCACGGTLKLIALIGEPVVIGKILTHIGLDPQSPPHLGSFFPIAQHVFLDLIFGLIAVAFAMRGFPYYNEHRKEEGAPR